MVTNNNSATKFTLCTANYDKIQNVVLTSASLVVYSSIFIFYHYCVNCNNMAEQEDKMDASTVKKLVIINLFNIARML